MAAILEAIGVDLGGTKIEVGRVDATGHVLKRIGFATDTEGGPQQIQNKIIEAIQELQNGSKIPLVGVGIGLAGQIDPLHGIVHFAPNLPDWEDIPLQENMQKILGLPVKVINDVRAIAWGEWLFGAGKSTQDLVCVFVGTGIGGGVVCAGKLLKGHSNTFGEVGHMVVDLDGPSCTCGNRGCWESIAGGWGIAKQAREAVLNDQVAGARLLKLSEQKIENISAKNVGEAYLQNDPLAISLIKKVQKALIAGCINLVNLYNPEFLILGGGLIDGIPEIVAVIEDGVRKKALKAATQGLKIVTARLGKQVGVIGAAAVVFDFLLKESNKKGEWK